MNKYTLVLTVIATVAFPGLLMAGKSNMNTAANGAVQMNDAEMDNVSAAGIGLGKANAPGQQMKLLLQQGLLVGCAHGNSCYAPGRNRGASTFAPGRIR